jgi:hypothetical protein
MIDYYIDIDDGAPKHFKTEKFKETIIRNSKPVMDFLYEKLVENDYNLEEFYNKCKDIIDDLPIMKFKIINNEIIIQYNRWIDIKLTDSTKQLYRDIKLDKLIS